MQIGDQEGWGMVGWAAESLRVARCPRFLVGGVGAGSDDRLANDVRELVAFIPQDDKTLFGEQVAFDDQAKPAVAFPKLLQAYS